MVNAISTHENNLSRRLLWLWPVLGGLWFSLILSAAAIEIESRVQHHQWKNDLLMRLPIVPAISVVLLWMLWAGVGSVNWVRQLLTFVGLFLASAIVYLLAMGLPESGTLIPRSQSLSQLGLNFFSSEFSIIWRQPIAGLGLGWVLLQALNFRNVAGNEGSVRGRLLPRFLGLAGALVGIFAIQNLVMPSQSNFWIGIWVLFAVYLFVAVHLCTWLLRRFAVWLAFPLVWLSMSPIGILCTNFVLGMTLSNSLTSDESQLAWGLGLLGFVTWTFSLFLFVWSHSGIREKQSGSAELAKQSHASQMRSLVGLGALWVLACFAAYWVPRNFDFRTAFMSERFIVQNGVLAAKVLRSTGGNRVVKPVATFMSRSGNRWVSNNAPDSRLERPFLEFANGLRGESIACLIIPALTPAQTDIVQAILDYKGSETECILEIQEPVADLDAVQKLLDAGIVVRCKLNGSGPLNIELLDHPLLHCSVVYGFTINAECLKQMAINYKIPRDLAYCQLPADFPDIVLPGGIRCYHCEIPDTAFEKLTDMAQAGNNVEVTLELEPTHLWSGDAVLRFLDSGGKLYGNLPLPRFVQKPFPNFFSGRNHLGDLVSVHRAAGALLTDPEAPDQLRQAFPRNWPMIKLDSQGDPLAIRLLIPDDVLPPTLWNVLPTVEHLELASYNVASWAMFQQQDLDPSVAEFQCSAFPAFRSVELIGLENISDSEARAAVEANAKRWLAPLLTCEHLRILYIHEPSPLVWSNFPAQTSIENLIIKVAPHPFSDSQPISPAKLVDRDDPRDNIWLERLAEMPNLHSLIIVDNNEDILEAYMSRMPGKQPAIASGTSAEQERRAQLWKQKVTAIRPDVEVTVVPSWSVWDSIK